MSLSLPQQKKINRMLSSKSILSNKDFSKVSKLLHNTDLRILTSHLLWPTAEQCAEAGLPFNLVSVFHELFIVWDIRLRSELGYWDDYDETIHERIRNCIEEIQAITGPRLQVATENVKERLVNRTRESVPELKNMSSHGIEEVLWDLTHRLS